MVGSSGGSASAASARRMAASAASRKPSTAAWRNEGMGPQIDDQFIDFHREKAWETPGVWWKSHEITLFQTSSHFVRREQVPEIMTYHDSKRPKRAKRQGKNQAPNQQHLSFTAEGIFAACACLSHAQDSAPMRASLK